MEIEQSLADAQEKLQIGREDLEKLLAQKKVFRASLKKINLNLTEVLLSSFLKQQMICKYHLLS